MTVIVGSNPTPSAQPDAKPVADLRKRRLQRISRLSDRAWLCPAGTGHLRLFVPATDEAVRRLPWARLEPGEVPAGPTPPAVFQPFQAGRG